MKNWRVVRVQRDGTLYVCEDPTYWTKKGAQAAATHLNVTFGAFVQLANALQGHNYFPTHVDKIPMLEKALDLAREK